MNSLQNIAIFYARITKHHEKVRGKLHAASLVKKLDDLEVEGNQVARDRWQQSEQLKAESS